MALTQLPVPFESSIHTLAPVAATVERLDGATVLWLHGELDLSTIGEESLAMATAIAEETALVVDLSEVEFLDAATIGLIASSASFVAERRRSLTVRAPSSFIARLFAVCGLEHLVAAA